MKRGVPSGMDNKPFVFRNVSVGNIAAVPKPFFRPLVHLVPRPIRRHFPFKLRKVQKNVAEQPAHRILRIQALRDRDELDGVAVKQLHEDVKSLTERVKRSILYARTQFNSRPEHRGAFP